MEMVYGGTSPVRMYREDVDLLRRKQRTASLERNRDVTGAELLHELMAAWRLDENGQGETP